MNFEEKKQIITLLSQYTTANKLVKMAECLKKRTRFVVPVLEDIYQSHNANAVIRSAECFGVQDVHVIEVMHTYASNVGVSKGASDWIQVYRHTSTQECFKRLREQGYFIVATTPSAEKAREYVINTLPVDRKIALVFGTEETGLSEYALQNADAFVTIPMYGFTESFNISVSVAICLYDITTRMRETSKWQLTQEEMIDVELMWLRRAVRGSAEIERRFLGK